MYLTTLLLLCASIAAPLLISGTVISSLFKARSCNLDDVVTFALAEDFSASNALTCAFFCGRNHNCLRALFNSSENVCKQSTSSITSQQLLEVVGLSAPQKVFLVHNPNCLVLVRHDGQPLKILSPPTSTPTPTLTPTSIPTSELTSTTQSQPEVGAIWNNLPFLPVFLITKEVVDDNETAVFQMSRISQSTQTIGGELIFTTIPRVLAVDGIKGSFFFPPIHEIKVVTVLPMGESRVAIYDVGLAGRKTESRNHSSELVDLFGNYYLNQDGQFQGVIFPVSIQDVRAAILNGYRRVETHPARSMIRTSDNDIYFDTTETIRVDPWGEVIYPPFFVTSFKESVKNLERYIFHNTFNTPDYLPRETTLITPPWVFETTWNKINLPNDHYSAVTELSSIFQEGKEVRIVLDKTISTDVVAVQMTVADVILFLPQYLFPFDGENVNVTHTRVRFPVISLWKKQNLECEMMFQDSTFTQKMALSYKNIEFFVSTYNWTLVYTVTPRDSPVGSFDELKRAVIGGLPVRVCVIEISSTLCHGGDSIHVTPNDEIVLESPQYLATVISKNQLDSIETGCHRRLRLVSTKKSVMTASFTVGWSATASWQGSGFSSLEWFVRYAPVGSSGTGVYEENGSGEEEEEAEEEDDV